MFEHIPEAQPDPILDLLDVFRTDDHPNKINLGIGVYKDETGKSPVLTSVKKAEFLLLKNETSKNYLSIDGIATFAACIQRLLFGVENAIINRQRVRSAQTPGGTGALRVAADFLAKNTTVKRVWVSNPSWPNHKNVFNAVGLEVCDYAYYDATTHAIDFNNLLASLRQARAGDVVLFHGCCHNPTGMDPNSYQWKELANLSAQNNWLPLFDFAYQGFAHGLEEDAEGLRIFCQAHQELIVCSSYSKNFSLYNERVGACTLVAADSATADRAFNQLKCTIRANYSNPPAHGAAIVAAILSDDMLRDMWKKELSGMRERIQRMRKLFVKTLKDKGAQQYFSFINKQNGMFSFIGLSKDQVLKLRDQSGIYVVNSGRINVAGMTSDNMNYLCEAIIAVL
ncbi:MAG: aspartate aminotransferase [Sodalis sp. Fse]|nr:MAG: aspartate aminotransferase [Sodalis sp. Fse]